MPTPDTPTISEHILEIRYAPNPKILDYRGTWAEMVSQLMGLKEWRITENRIDVFEIDESRRAFVSFKNAGVVIHNSPTQNYFPDQTNKLLRFLLEQKSFGNPLFVIRLGVRSRFATTFAGSFKELLERYSTRFFTLTLEAKNAFNAEIIDIGFPLNFSTNLGKINTNSGPMEKDQLEKIFRFEEKENLPDVALYVDLDYWIRPEKLLEGKDILKIIRTFAEEIWDTHERVRTLILG